MLYEEMPALRRLFYARESSDIIGKLMRPHTSSHSNRYCTLKATAIQLYSIAILRNVSGVYSTYTTRYLYIFSFSHISATTKSQ